MSETEREDGVEETEVGAPEPGLESLMDEESAALLNGEEEDALFASDPDAPAEDAPALFSEGPLALDDESVGVDEPADAQPPPADAATDAVTDGADAPAGPAPAAGEDLSDLEARAAAAFDELLTEPAVEDIDDESIVVPEEPPSALASAPVVAKRWSRDQILFGLLVANMLLMGVMILLPGSNTPDSGNASPSPTKHAPTSDAKAGTPVPVTKSPDPFHAPLREPSEFLPNHELYNASEQLLSKGNYAKAAELLERYLKAHPELQPFQLQLVYSRLSYCLRMDGRRPEALAYMAKYDNLREITSLPDDLWAAAEQAEADGRGHDMRRYYARFLLQQDQLGKRWSKQGKIIDAYLKIGDSYRIDAERGVRRETGPPSINRTLKKPTGNEKPRVKAKPAPKGGGH